MANLRGLPLVSPGIPTVRLFIVNINVASTCFIYKTTGKGAGRSRKVSAKHVSNTAASPKCPNFADGGGAIPAKIVDWKTKSICMPGRLKWNFLNFEVLGKIEMILITCRVESGSQGSTIKYWNTHKLLQHKMLFTPEIPFSSGLEGTLTFSSNL